MEKVNHNASRKLFALASCVLALGLLPGAQAQSGEQLLLQKAQSLATDGHLDMAVQAWQQVLLANPKNREALLGIAKADMQMGKADEARTYLQRLRSAGGNPADIAKIEAMPQALPQNERIREAGQLAQNGRYADAMRIYRDVLGDNPPAGNYALAYYDTEAAIPEDRPHAIAGLRRLAKQFPADSRYAITLGRVLTYDPKTRAEGISILEKYGSIPSAQTALNQAKAWSSVAATAPAAKPTPSATATTAPSAPAMDSPERAAYRALNSGRLDEAAQQFQAILAKRPENASALSGMGYVYMKQQDFVQATSYFERARTAGARGLESVIATSRFWQQMNMANQQLQAGDTQSAIDSYRAATTMKPSSPEAFEGLGGAQMKVGNLTEAADSYQRAVNLSPSREESWRGLFIANSMLGEASAALDVNARMPKNIRDRLYSDPEVLRQLAQDYTAVGRKADADRTIERALALPFPNEGRDLTPDKQMQYASLLMAAKKYEPALRLYRQIVAQQPDNTGAWLALIAAEHQLGHEQEALAVVSSMPQSVMDKQQNDPAFLALVGSIYQTEHQWDRAQRYLERALSLAPPPQAGIQMQLADIYAAQGNTEKAYSIYRRQLDTNPENLAAWRGLLNTLHLENRDREALRQISSMPESVRLRLEGDTSYLQTLASIQSSAGQNQAALKTFAQLAQMYRDSNTDMPVDVQIHYGWVLLNAGDDRRLYSLVTNLSTSPDMTDEQQAQFSQLWASWSVRRANSALAAGDQQKAMAILAAASQAFPNNPDVAGALAGVYMKAGQPKEAVAIYASRDMSHASLVQYRAAIGAALAARDMKQAETWLEGALDQYKSDPEILKMAAQYEQARGNHDRAVAYYRAALDAMGPASSPGLLFTPGGQNGQPGTLSPTDQLMQLLAPRGQASRSGGPVDPTLDPGLDPSLNQQRSSVTWQDAPPVNTPTLGEFADNSSHMAAPELPTERAPAPTEAANYAPASADDLPEQIYVPPVHHVSRAALPVEREPVSSSVNYVKPVAMDVAPQQIEPPQVVPPPSVERTSKARPFVDANDSNPANRLQLAVHQMNTQVPDTGLPPIAQQAPEEGSSTLPPFSTRETAKVEAPVLPPLTGPGVRVVRQQTPRQQIEEQLAILHGAGSPWVGGDSSVDYRSGQPGYDRLAIYTGQIEASSMLGPGVRGTIITRPVLLDSGSATSTETFQQGTLPADSLPYLQSAAGIGGEFQLRAASFGANLGYTPHGFLIENVTGGIYVHPPTSHFTITFSRDPITDTQLSYAGLRDLGSRSDTYIGNTWGGVMTNAGELQLAFGDAQSGWYIQGGGQYITGTHVQDNKRMDGDAGAYWSVLHHPDYGTLTVGMNFFGMHYTHNLRYFTYGQGGYFSPAAYMLAGVPFTFAGHYGPRFHYRAIGSIGLQAFQENSTPYYPLDPTLQYARGNPYYSESTSVSGNYSFQGEGAYAIAEHWYVGGFLSFNNTRDYASNRGGFFVRYLFRPQPMLEENGPTGIFPIQGFRPLQVP